MSRRVGLGLSVLAIIEVLTGFVTQTLVIGMVGTNRLSDAYYVALALPQFFLTVVAAPIVSVLIPLLAASDASRAPGQATVALAWSTGVSTVCALVGAVTSPLWLPALFPSFTGADEALAAHLVLVQLLSMVPATGCMIWKATCYARRRFLAAEAISVAGAVAGLIALVITVPRYGVIAAVWVNVARYSLTLVAMIVLERVRRPAPMRGEFAGRLWGRTRPLVIGALFYKSEPLVDQHLSSMSSSGDLTLFSFCRTVLTSGVLVLSQALIAPIIPDLAVFAEARDWASVRARLRQRMAIIGGAAAAAMLVFAVAGLPVLAFVASAWPRFAHMPLHTLWALLILLAGIPIAGGASQIVTATYYAIGETRLLTIIGVVNYGIGIVLKFAGFAIDGLWGLAIATTIYYAFDAIVQWIVLEWRLAGLARQKLAIENPEAMIE